MLIIDGERAVLLQRKTEVTSILQQESTLLLQGTEKLTSYKWRLARKRTCPNHNNVQSCI